MLELGIGIQGAKPVVSGSGLADPLGTVKAISSLIEAGHRIGLEFSLSTDFAELGKMRQRIRQSNVSPMFDSEADRNIGEHGFWMNAVNDKNEVVALQAFRLDEAEPNLADWALGWMMGLYARRRELIVPRQPKPPEHSRTSLIKGKLAYHGEFWVEKHCKGCFNIFPRLGLLLALVKWQPEAIWALTGESMATRGHMIRAGYGHIEQSFLTWEWEPEGAEPNEWIAIAERRHLEFSVAQMTSTKAKYRLSPVP
jgi:hypothetical protein